MMKSPLRTVSRGVHGYLSGIMMAVVIFSGLTGCTVHSPNITVPQDQPLTAVQTNLLQIAFDTATAIPVYPHHKDQAKMQFAVVTACFELNQPQRALLYSEKIGDWRRGAGYADYAFYCAQHRLTNDVPYYLKRAEEISATADQDWRRDRIKARIAQTHLVLGQTNESARMAAGLEKSESGHVDQLGATQCDDREFSVYSEKLDALILTGDFELIKNSLQAYTELFNRFYGHIERREQIEAKIKASWNPLPVFLRIDLLTKLVEGSLDHADPAKALELLDDATEILEGSIWPVEHRIPQAARLAELRFRAGDPVAARAALQAERNLFFEKQGEIVNIDKAETLLPLAEAFRATGDSAEALAVYKQAVEAAVENPNSRPRAEDLTAICLSAALHEVEPDAALWGRIREIQAGLGDPW